MAKFSDLQQCVFSDPIKAKLTQEERAALLVDIIWMAGIDPFNTDNICDPMAEDLKRALELIKETDKKQNE